MNILILDGAYCFDDYAMAIEWPGPLWPGWISYNDQAHCKRASDLTHPIPAYIGLMLAKMAHWPTVRKVFDGPLIPDISLHGAGLHEIGTGPAVGRHLDADTHPRLGIRRALSMSLYVHREWRPEWGGQLVFESGVTVEPVPGRAVIFDSENEWHRVEPVKAPAGVTRRSLAMFWYTAHPGEWERKRALFKES